MKTLKVTKANKSKIEENLVLLNGNKISDTYRDGTEIMDLATHAEKQLEEMGIEKKDRRGAYLKAMSGGNLPKAYKWSRWVTVVHLERKAADWYLTSCELTERWGDAQQPQTYITERQDEIAVAKFRSTYAVQPEVQA